MTAVLQPQVEPSGRLVAFEPPSHWEVKPLRYLFDAVGGATPSKDNLGYWEGHIPWVSPKDMKSEVIKDSEDHISDLALTETRLALLPPSTVLVVVRGMILLHTIPIAITAVDTTINQDMKALFPKTGILPEYLAHLLRAVSHILFSTIEESGHGTRCLRLDLWRQILVGVPPTDEQRTIVKLIERRSAQIDALIGKKQRQIELLQERRQAFISQSVTHGLDTNVKMKFSGFSSIGDIPNHWDARRLKFLCSLIKDGTHLPPPRTDEGYPLLSVRNIVNGRFVNLPDDSLISKADYLQLTKTVTPFRGDILLAIVGATMGKVAMVGEMPPFAIQRSLALIRPNPRFIDNRFLFLFFQGHQFQRILWQYTGFSAQPGIYLGALADFASTVPPLQEQVKIVETLHRELSSQDEMRAKIELQIDQLHEYRQALITAAVTGKIDVSPVESVTGDVS